MTMTASPSRQQEDSACTAMYTESTSLRTAVQYEARYSCTVQYVKSKAQSNLILLNNSRSAFWNSPLTMARSNYVQPRAPARTVPDSSQPDW